MSDEMAAKETKETTVFDLVRELRSDVSQSEDILGIGIAGDPVMAEPGRLSTIVAIAEQLADLHDRMCNVNQQIGQLGS